MNSQEYTTLENSLTTSTRSTSSSSTTSTVSTVVKTTTIATKTSANSSDIDYESSKNSIVQILTVANTSINKINSTETSEKSKSLLPIILASTIGGLAIFVLVASIITYILIKQGYIKLFNQPRTQIRNDKQRRLADSSSTIDGASPSQK